MPLGLQGPKIGIGISVPLNAMSEDSTQMLSQTCTPANLHPRGWSLPPLAPSGPKAELPASISLTLPGEEKSKQMEGLKPDGGGN